MKFYTHTGAVSVVICVANNLDDAIEMIRTELDSVVYVKL